MYNFFLEKIQYFYSSLYSTRSWVLVGSGPQFFVFVSSTLVLASHSWVRNSGRVFLTKQTHSGQKSLWPKPDLQNGADISKLLWKGSILWLGGINPPPPPPPPHVHISGGGGGGGGISGSGWKTDPPTLRGPSRPPSLSAHAVCVWPITKKGIFFTLSV